MKRKPRKIGKLVRRWLGMDAPIPCPTHGFDCDLPNNLRKNLVIHLDSRDMAMGFEGLQRILDECLRESDEATEEKNQETEEDRS